MSSLALPTYTFIHHPNHLTEITHDLGTKDTKYRDSSWNFPNMISVPSLKLTMNLVKYSRCTFHCTKPSAPLSNSSIDQFFVLVMITCALPEHWRYCILPHLKLLMSSSTPPHHINR
jgi:hypothetical protein